MQFRIIGMMTVTFAMTGGRIGWFLPLISAVDNSSSWMWTSSATWTAGRVRGGGDGCARTVITGAFSADTFGIGIDPVDRKQEVTC